MTMKKAKRSKLIVLLLAMCFIFSVLPVTGFAEAALTVGWQKDERTALSARTNVSYKYVLYSYRDANGHFYNNEWKKIGGKWYYFTDTTDKYNFSAFGRMAENEWVNGYWFNKNGSWTYKYRGSWKKNAQGYWYGDTSGWYAKSCWQKIDGKDYYFNAKGYMVTGWQKIGGRWYYFKSSGAMAALENVYLGNYRYYFFGDGSYYQFAK